MQMGKLLIRMKDRYPFRFNGVSWLLFIDFSIRMTLVGSSLHYLALELEENCPVFILSLILWLKSTKIYRRRWIECMEFRDVHSNSSVCIRFIAALNGKPIYRTKQLGAREHTHTKTYIQMLETSIGTLSQRSSIERSRLSEQRS